MKTHNHIQVTTMILEESLCFYTSEQNCSEHPKTTVTKLSHMILYHLTIVVQQFLYTSFRTDRTVLCAVLV